MFIVSIAALVGLAGALTGASPRVVTDVMSTKTGPG